MVRFYWGTIFVTIIITFLIGLTIMSYFPGLSSKFSRGWRKLGMWKWAIVAILIGLLWLNEKTAVLEDMIRKLK